MVGVGGWQAELVTRLRFGLNFEDRKIGIWLGRAPPALLPRAPRLRRAKLPSRSSSSGFFSLLF
jgi:hypothetical protein